MQRHHGADAAGRPQPGVAVLFVDLLHHDDAITKLGQEHLIGVRGDDGRLHHRDGHAEMVEDGLQRFELLAQQDALEPLLLGFTGRRLVGGRRGR